MNPHLDTTSLRSVPGAAFRASVGLAALVFALTCASAQSQVVVIDSFDDPVEQLSGVFPGSPGGTDQSTGSGIYGGGTRNLRCTISGPGQTSSASLRVADGKVTGAVGSAESFKVGQVTMNYTGFGSLNVDPSGTMELELTSQYQGAITSNVMMAPMEIRLDLRNADFKSKTWLVNGSTTSEGITFDLSSPTFGSSDFDYSAVESITLTFTAAYMGTPDPVTSYSFEIDSISLSTLPPIPGISVRPTSLSELSTTIGSASSSKSFTVSGSQLTGDITLTAPSGFEISSDNTNFSTTLMLTPSADELPATTLHARIAAAAPFGPLSGDLTLSSPDVASKTLPLSGSVIGLISTTPSSLSDLTAIQPAASASQSFTVNVSTLSPDSVDGPVTGLSPAITVSAPSGVQVSLNDVNFSSSVSLTAVPATVYVRLVANAPLGAVSRILSLYSASFATATVAVSGQVSPPQDSLVLSGSNGNNTIASDYTMTNGYSIALGLNADYLLVGGGGGGGGATTSLFGGGGGGAGAVVSGSLVLAPETMRVVVGDGGAGGSNSATLADRTGKTGLTTSFKALNAVGGGGGGAGANDASNVGLGGASGGGGGGGGNSSQAGSAGGTATNGFNGGASVNNTATAPNGSSSNRWAGGGGGGASAVGTAGTQQSSNSGFAKGGDGGVPQTSQITGSTTSYGGGGGGGAVGTGTFGNPTNTPGSGGGAGAGNGGAGTSGAQPGNAATANTGSGGGGAGREGSGGKGGSGLVIVRYQGAPIATGGTITAGSGSAAGHTLHTFSTVGESSLVLTEQNLNSLIGTTLTGTISGSGGLTFNGPGTLTLAADNTFTGTTVISSGTLQLGNGGATGSVPGPILNQGILNIHRSDDFTLSNAVSGSGTLVKLGTNTLTLSGNVSGPVTVSAGTVVVNGTAGAVSVSAGATLAGVGTTGNVLLAEGASIAPGNAGIGTLHTANLSLAGNTSWNWNVQSTTGSAGTAADLIQSTGALTLSATPSKPIAFNISALGDFGLTGVKQASWVIGSFPGGITGFDPAAFAIQTGAMTVPQGGVFSIVMENNTLRLNYIAPFVTPAVASLSGFNAMPGSASSSQSFTFEGAALLEPVIVTAPAGFEISEDGVSYSNSLSLGSIDIGTIQSIYGGDFTTASGSVWQTGSGKQYPNVWAFAALKGDGSVVTWGHATYGGDSSAVSSQLSANVMALYSTASAFAALKRDGSVVTWGDPSAGGDSSAVASQLSSGVSAIYSTASAFAALKSNGSVVTWGRAGFGGNSSTVASQLTSGVVTIYSNTNAFAALKSDGSVVTWGSSTLGGDSSAVASQLSSGVSAIYSTTSAFAALKSNGSVVTWGSASSGADSFAVSSQIAGGVVRIYSTSEAFAALKSDGSVVTWGNSDKGGNSTSVSSSIGSGVTAIYSNLEAFAALKSDGSVVTWGWPTLGGDSSAVSNQLAGNVTAIYSVEWAFAALKSDGSVVAWGNPSYGGAFYGAAPKLTNGVVSISSTRSAFAALKSDGSVVTWGWSTDGGSSFNVASQLASEVIGVYATRTAFAALKSDGTVVTWGDANAGGSNGPGNIATPKPPTLPVTLHVRLASDAPEGSISGNLTIASTGAATETVALSGTVGEFSSLTALEAWRQQYFGSSANNGNGANLATPDGDGISNLVKYALNLTPGSSSLASLPQPQWTQLGGNRFLSLAITRDPARNDVSIFIEAGDDLVGWTVVGSSVNGAAFTGGGFVSETDAAGGLKLCVVRDTVNSTTAPRRFMRVRVKAGN